MSCGNLKPFLAGKKQVYKFFIIGSYYNKKKVISPKLETDLEIKIRYNNTLYYNHYSFTIF